MPNSGKYLGLGANLGDPAAAIEQALHEIEARGLGRVISRSSLYRTEPVGITDQPWFVNAAAEIETDLALRDFHQGLQALERDLGRPDQRIKDGPRVIDLDVLLWGDLILDDQDLVIPHPRMHERRFVLAPLAEIAADALHPGLNRTVGALLAGLADPAEVEKLLEDER